MKTYKRFIEENVGAYVAGYAIGYFGAALVVKGVKKAKKALSAYKNRKEIQKELDDLENFAKKHDMKSVDVNPDGSVNEGVKEGDAAIKNYMLKKLKVAKKILSKNKNTIEVIGTIIALALVASLDDKIKASNANKRNAKNSTVYTPSQASKDIDDLMSFIQKGNFA